MTPPFPYTKPLNVASAVALNVRVFDGVVKLIYVFEADTAVPVKLTDPSPETLNIWLKDEVFAIPAPLNVKGSKIENVYDAVVPLKLKLPTVKAAVVLADGKTPLNVQVPVGTELDSQLLPVLRFPLLSEPSHVLFVAESEHCKAKTVAAK